MPVEIEVASESTAGLFDVGACLVQSERRALTILEKALGPEHPDVAHSLNNLARLCHAQGQYAEAQPLYQPGADTGTFSTPSSTRRPTRQLRKVVAVTQDPPNFHFLRQILLNDFHHLGEKHVRWRFAISLLYIDSTQPRSISGSRLRVSVVRSISSRFVRVESDCASRDKFDNSEYCDSVIPLGARYGS